MASGLGGGESDGRAANHSGQISKTRRGTSLCSTIGMRAHVLVPSTSFYIIPPIPAVIAVLCRCPLSCLSPSVACRWCHPGAPWPCLALSRSLSVSLLPGSPCLCQHHHNFHHAMKQEAAWAFVPYCRVYRVCPSQCKYECAVHHSAHSIQRTHSTHSTSPHTRTSSRHTHALLPHVAAARHHIIV